MRMHNLVSTALKADHQKCHATKVTVLVWFERCTKILCRFVQSLIASS